MTHIEISKQPIDIAKAYQWLSSGETDGAVVTFTGKVRNHNLGDSVSALTLEHYPGMTEKTLHNIVLDARARWSLQRVILTHRVGDLAPGDDIVYVGVTADHRGDAFAAAEMLMDFLKTSAPFWKKETLTSGKRWIEARESDEAARQRWQSV
ncbi:MAG: Molybdopterin synthase catalytic subunit [Candidatus Erwinia impunctatus]|nr:Molybdopterin synthase catalytic subunit [Culicoides impunctatus]